MTKDLSLTKQLELANETIRKMQESINELMSKMDVRTREVHYIKKEYDDIKNRANTLQRNFTVQLARSEKQEGWIEAHKEIMNHKARVDRLPEPYQEVKFKLDYSSEPNNYKVNNNIDSNKY